MPFFTSAPAIFDKDAAVLAAAHVKAGIAAAAEGVLADASSFVLLNMGAVGEGASGLGRRSGDVLAAGFGQPTSWLTQEFGSGFRAAHGRCAGWVSFDLVGRENRSPAGT
jgi:hypothetical protein